jgi:hypothetical protein
MTDQLARNMLAETAFAAQLQHLQTAIPEQQVRCPALAEFTLT